MLIAIGFCISGLRKLWFNSLPPERKAAIAQKREERARRQQAKLNSPTYTRFRCCAYWNDINADPYNEYGGLLDGGDYDINSRRRCTCGHTRCRGYRVGLHR